MAYGTPRSCERCFRWNHRSRWARRISRAGYPGLLIRRPREKDSGDGAVQDREALPGLFGLIPHWATDLKIYCSTNYACSETVLLSFTMLTMNPENHDLFKHVHTPQDEKRMVVILHEHQYDKWLKAPAAKSAEFMRQYPAHLLITSPDLEQGTKRRQVIQQRKRRG
jgi:hypothetical protein